MFSQQNVVRNIAKNIQIKKQYSYLLANIWQGVGVFSGGCGKEWGHVSGWRGIWKFGSRVNINELGYILTNYFEIIFWEVRYI